MSDSWLRMVRHGVGDVARNYGLTPHERVVLDELVHCADWRTAEWTGTVTELAGDARVNRRVAAAAVDRLAGLGLVDKVRGFSGRGESGLVYVAVYDTLIKPERRRSPLIQRRRDPVPIGPPDCEQIRAQGSEGLRATCAHAARDLRADVAQMYSQGPTPTSTDVFTRGDEAEKEAEEVENPGRADTACEHCGAHGSWEVDGALLCNPCADLAESDSKIRAAFDVEAVA